MPARTTPSYLNFDQSGLSLEVRHRLPRPSQTLSRRQGRAGRPHLRTLQERDCAPLAVQNAGYRKTQRESDLQNVYRLFRRRRLRRRLARKFLQMGYTRARRYANYKGGRKYDKDNDYKLQERGDRRSRESRKRRDLLRVLEEGGEREALRRAKEGLERQYRMKLPILPVYYYQHRLPS